MHSAQHGPETAGRHRRVEASAALTETGRHRAVAARPEPVAAPAVVEPVRRRHAADAAPATHPDARVRTRSRTPQRLVAGTALLAIAMAPVLARSSSALGLHDAVAAEVAANPDQAEDTLEALSRGGVLAASITPSPTAEPDSVTAGTGGPSTPSGSTSAGTGTAGPATAGSAPSGSTSSGSTPSGSTPSGSTSSGPTPDGGTPGAGPSSTASAPPVVGGQSAPGAPLTPDGGSTVPTAAGSAPSPAPGTGPTTDPTTQAGGSPTAGTPEASVPEDQAAPTRTTAEQEVAPVTTDATTPTSRAAEPTGDPIESVIASITAVLGG